MRNDTRLKDIPIIMITSRVGEKHRARAIELGVNDYLGKPYQEDQLLQAIEPAGRQRARMSAGHGVYGLLLPLLDERLLVPRACVAEVTGYQPRRMPGAPPWYLGTSGWNDAACR